MNTYVVGDIHGAYLALEELLQTISLKASDSLIFLGDYVDGWSQSPEVIDALISLKSQYNCIFIRGNHDDLFLNYLKTGRFSQEWIIHGGQSTLDAYRNISLEKLNQHIAFLESLQPYYVDASNRLFLHAGFTNQKGIAFEYFPEMFFWDRTLWETAVATDERMTENHPYFPMRLRIYTKVFIGHTPTTRLGSTMPLNFHNVWNLDTGAAFKGPLTVMEVETERIWQSTPVYQLYPKENGRN